MSVKIEVDVLNQIISFFNRVNSNQTRVYGIVLGTQNKDVYHITHAIHGFINEEGKENGKISFNRLSSESTNTLLSSYASTYPNEGILGGFATDKELFPELNTLHGTISMISSKIFPNKNAIVLLVDAFHKDKNNLEYGVRVFRWKSNYFSGKNKEDLSIISFSELSCQVVQKVNLSGIINTKGIDIWKIDNEIDNLDTNGITNVEGIIGAIEKISAANQKIEDGEENKKYIMMQLKICEKYLDFLGKYVEGVKEGTEETELLNKINYAICLLKPFIDKNDILDIMQKDAERNKVLNSLIGLLNVQVKLTEKVNKFNI